MIKQFFCNLVSQHQLNDRGYIDASNWKRWSCFAGQEREREGRITFQLENKPPLPKHPLKPDWIEKGEINV